MIDFVAEAKELFPLVVDCRRDLHRHPEIGSQEFRTSEIVATTLESLGIEVTRNVGAPYPGVVGLLRGGKPGPTVALRADMDALPVTEVKDSDYKSETPGMMHACGHDAHTSIALGAARLLAKHRDELHGNVKFIFQPNEEREGGAVPMIADGALEGVDAIFGLHVDPDYPTGMVVSKNEAVMAASDWLMIDVCGTGAHGAYPHRGVDAIVIAGQFITAVQALISRELNPLDSAVITFGAISGGKTRNVICDNVHLEGILRTLKPEVRERTITRIEAMLDGITKAYGGSYQFKRKKSYSATINDGRFVDFIQQNAVSLFGEGAFTPLPGSRLGCEDFGYYLEKVPGAFWFLGTGNAEKDTQHPWHSPLFNIDEDALVNGVALQAALAYRYLESPIR